MYFSDKLPQVIDTVAFMARKHGNQRVDLGDIIRFTHVLVNYGNHYDTDTSLFVCPDNNLYVFFATLLSQPGSTVWFSIVKDGVSQGEGITGSGPGQNTGTEVAVVQCTPRSQIWVQCHHRAANQVITTNHSYFGGFLLSLDVPDQNKV